MKLIKLLENSTAISDVTIMSEDELQYFRSKTSHENSDIYNRLKYLHPGTIWSKESHFAVMIGKKIVGIGSVQINPEDKQQLWLKHVSVDPKYEGQGIARKIIERIYQWAHTQNLKVFPSTYSAKGSNTIRSTIDRMGRQYPDNHIPNTNTPFGESFVTELQNPISHYRNVLRGEWDLPYDLEEYLKNNGYEKLGFGIFSGVFAKPGEKFVLKVNRRPDCYLDFVKKLSRNMNPHLPRVGTIRIYNEGDSKNKWYVIPLEKLEEITLEDHISRYDVLFVLSRALMLDPKHMYLSSEVRPLLPAPPEEIYDRLKDRFNKLDSALKFVEDNFYNVCNIDLHEGNIMLRGDTIVITDPVSFYKGQE